MRTSLERFVGVARISAQPINQVGPRKLFLIIRFVKPTKSLSFSSARPLASRAARRQQLLNEIRFFEFNEFEFS
jgi:hypothetical protein